MTAIQARAEEQELEDRVPAATRPRRRWGRTVVATGALVAVAGVAAAAALGVVGGSSGSGGSAASNLPPATAEAIRTTLVATEDLEGALGYGEPVTWSSSGGGAEGIVTWLPATGETIRRGERGYEVNAAPVVLLYGSMPFYRPLRAGDSGMDVEQLEQNLSKLGYGGFTVDGEYTSATVDVVAQWQEDAGLPATGEFDPAHAVVAPGAVRVAAHLAALGDPANGPILAYTDTDQQVTVELEVIDQQLLTEEMPVTVRLPDGATVDATVTEVGTVVTATGSEADGGEDDATTSVEVTITVDDSEELGDWDEAPVDVTIEVDRREDVLAVPVGALVALPDGGYGVQVVDGDRTSYLPVETSLFADGMVEITGGDLVEGMIVGVPS